MGEHVVISGYFMIFHVGSIDYIKSASRLGKLTVIVNSDEQAKKKYGSIIVPAIQRAEILRNIKGVYNSVIAIDEDESVALTLEMIRPTIFLNSGDRNISNSNPKEKEVCDRLGIKIVYDNSPKIQSSSSIIERIKQL
jgi:cytidyltransferase-like protein